MSRRRPQHSKGKKRPRGWHRGRAEGKLGEQALTVNEPLFDHAAADLKLEKNSDLLDEIAMWGELEHVNPFVPRLELFAQPAT